MSQHEITTPAQAAPGDQALTQLRSPAGVALIVATVFASTIGFLDATVVDIAVPAIGKDLGGSVDELQWVVTSYLLVVTALLLVAGSLADRLGRKQILIIGLLITLVGSIFCAVAPTATLLIAARVVQGLGGALVVPSSLAFLNGALRVADRAHAIGIWAGLSTLGTTIGPYAGGWLVDHGSWRLVFLLNIPLVAIALIAVSRVRKGPTLVVSGKLDIGGALLAAVGIGGIVYALTDGSANGWNQPLAIVFGAIGIAALVALVPVERRRSSPVLRPSLFRSRQFNAINASTILFYGALSGAGFLLTLQLQLTLKYSPSASGAALIPSSLVFLAVSPFAGALVSKFGTRWLMAVGIGLVGVSLLYLSTAGVHSAYLAAILPAALVQGLGLGLAVTPLTSAVLAAVRSEDLGEASAVNNAVSRLGGVIAIAVLPAIAGATSGRSLTQALAGSYRPGMIATFILCLIAAAIAIAFVRRDVPESAGPMPVGEHAPGAHLTEIPSTYPTNN